MDCVGASIKDLNACLMKGQEIARTHQIFSSCLCCFSCRLSQSDKDGLETFHRDNLCYAKLNIMFRIFSGSSELSR